MLTRPMEGISPLRPECESAVVLVIGITITPPWTPILTDKSPVPSPTRLTLAIPEQGQEMRLHSILRSILRMVIVTMLQYPPTDIFLTTRRARSMFVAEWTGWWQHQPAGALHPLSVAGERFGIIQLCGFHRPLLVLSLTFLLYLPVPTLYLLLIQGNTIPSSSKQEKILIVILSDGMQRPEVTALPSTLPYPKSSLIVLTHLPWLLTRIIFSAQVLSSPAGRRPLPSLGQISVAVSATLRPLLTLMHGIRRKISRL